MQNISEFLIQLFVKNRVVKSATLLAGSSALGQLVVVLSSPFLTHLYQPKDFGVLSIYISILSITTVIACLRYEQAIPLSRSRRRAVNVFLVCISSACIVSIFIFILMCVSSRLPIPVAFSRNIKMYLWVVPLGTLGAGIYQSLVYWAIRFKEFTTLARTKVTQMSTIVALQFLLGLFSFGGFSLVISQFIGQFSGIGTLTTSLTKTQKTAKKSITIRTLLSTAERYRRFPIISSGSALLNSFTLQIPVLTLALVYNTEVVGLYAMAQRVLGLPVNVIGTSIGQVFIGEAAQLVRQSSKSLLRLYFRTLFYLTICGLPIMLVIVTFGPKLFSTVFGPTWVESGHYIRLLSLNYLLQFVCMGISGTLDVLERQDLHLIREAIRISLLLSVMGISFAKKIPPSTSVLMFGIAGGFGYVIYICIGWYAIYQRNTVTNKYSRAMEQTMV